jgi:hypothetical protein
VTVERFLTHEYVECWDVPGAQGSSINGQEMEEDTVSAVFDGREIAGEDAVPKLVMAEHFELEWSKTRCRFCSFEFLELSFVPTAEARWRPHRIHFKFCLRCRFWLFGSTQYDHPRLGCRQEAFAIAHARDFAARLPEGAASELAVLLRRDPSLFHRLAPRDTEILVKDVLKANHRDAEVIHVGRPGDDGYDVLLIDDADRQWLVQVKRREDPDAVEGYATFESMAGALYINDQPQGMIVSTARRFSRKALRKAAEMKKRDVTIALIDRGKLDRMLSPLLPRDPWRTAMKAFVPSALPEVTAAVERALDEHAP